MKQLLLTILGLIFLSNLAFSQSKTSDFLRFNFDRNVKAQNYKLVDSEFQFVKGLEDKALSVQSGKISDNLTLNNLGLDGSTDFSVQCWIQTSSTKPTVILSQKNFLDKSISSQKNKGWVLYTSGGTFAWSIGSGKRRLNYERDNGDKMPLCDGAWHQLTMTYSKEKSEVRLYFDGHNKAIYKVGFDFANDNPLIIGTNKNNIDYSQTLFPEIEKGASQLQTLVDEFNDLEMGDLEDDEYLNLIVDMDELISVKKNKLDSIQLKAIKSSDITSVKKLRSALSENPYTVFQNLELTRLKPISQIYYLENGKIKINTKEARKYTDKTQLFPSDFNIDNLSIWKKEISAEDVLANYTKYRSTTAFKFEKNIKKLNVGDWNIWHGGKHFSIKDFGWDSRNRIVEVIKKNNIDVLLMQETYSSGDYIAAELGYYFATTSDWDYCYQGSNVSVISRYPIKELLVPLEASFMNVGAKIAISETQEIYAMSNWYGMGSFPIVYDFHKERFDKADEIPIIFGGDFNAIPNSDGGENPASITLIENGFKDAYRSLHPDVKIFPGYTHEWGERIDQIYYKGKGLKNTSTEVISTAFGGFPSDHFMIFSKFELNY